MGTHGKWRQETEGNSGSGLLFAYVSTRGPAPVAIEKASRASKRTSPER